ncbi:MAG: hypothetical protein QOD83_1408 [Solirubrobacteraceae bacterium]|jgi:hypothetical protein|nr:hypothetical protein [Solirubrobacteraceae bacterium]
MSTDSPRFPVLRLVAVRVIQSAVGILIVLIGKAGVPVVALAMIVAGVVLGVWQERRWAPTHAHAVTTGLVLAGATVGHTLAVLNAPVATVETVVQMGALLPLVASPTQRRRPVVVLLVVACVFTGGLFVGFAGGSVLGIGLATVAGICAGLLVMRLETRPRGLAPARYQAVSITVGGVALLPLGILLDGSTLAASTALVLAALIAIFAVTNLELGRIVPATGAVVAMSSSGLRPIAALFLGALVIDQDITASAIVLGASYAVALAGLVRQVERVPVAEVP